MFGEYFKPNCTVNYVIQRQSRSQTNERILRETATSAEETFILIQQQRSRFKRPKNKSYSNRDREGRMYRQ